MTPSGTSRRPCDPAAPGGTQQTTAALGFLNMMIDHRLYYTYFSLAIFQNVFGAIGFTVLVQ